MCLREGDSRKWDTVDRLRDWLDAESPATGGNAKPLRVLKIGEESGEAAEAMHGTMAANPRKGASHTWEDVHKELCDVTITAMIALASLTPDARKMFDDRLQHIADRSLTS